MRLFEIEERSKVGSSVQLVNPIYHVSSGSNARSILINGLRPSIDSYEKKMGEKDPVRAVFFFIKIDDAKNLQEYIGKSACIFEINPEHLNLFWANYADPATKGSGDVVVSLDKVPSSEIKLISPESALKKYNKDAMIDTLSSNKDKVKLINTLLKSFDLKIKCLNTVCMRVGVYKSTINPIVGVFQLSELADGLRNTSMMRNGKGDGWNDGSFYDELDFSIPVVSSDIIDKIEQICRL